MLGNAKALVVVLALALATFHFCRPIAVHFMREETFARRRNVWLAMTVVGFLSPSFWIWTIFSAVLLVWAARRDANPLGLYCFVMLTVPPVSLQIPVPVINQLFDMTPARLLVFTVIAVALFRKRDGGDARPVFGTSDAILLAFLTLQVVTLIPFETVSNTLRRAFLATVDSLLILYAFSRIVGRERITDTMASFWMAMIISAPIAIFEWLRGWLLYTGIASGWGAPNEFAWLMRGNSLRAQAASGHSIGLGYLSAIGLGLFLYLRGRARITRALDLTVLAAMSTAILVSFSRGAWVTAACAIIVFALLRPESMRHLGRFALLTGAAVAIALVTPLKEAVVDRLPIVGTSDQDTIEYRQQLFESSWDLVLQHPWIGDPFVLLRMESLRQGQGIIDIVNGYLYTALFNGFIGLFLLCLVFAFAIRAGVRAWAAASSDPDFRALAAGVLSCMVATLVYIATAGHTLVTFILCGLLISAEAATRVTLHPGSFVHPIAMPHPPA